MNDVPQSETSRRVLRFDCKIDSNFSVKWNACVKHSVCLCVCVCVRVRVCVCAVRTCHYLIPIKTPPACKTGSLNLLVD